MIKTKTTLLLAAVMAIFMVFPACSSKDSASSIISSGTASDESKALAENGSSGGYHKLTAEEAKAMMDGSEDIIVVDVRTQEEYDEGHIPNSVLIPNETITQTPPEQLPDKDATILIYCRSGNRSRQAAEKLLAMGYTNIYDFGGIRDWPYDVITD
ncbi:MAG: rhodanese-like domain-containing protein [Angelakisella sp.]|nr:rhodanese-like domain-containing protein [Angelakisella sp.]